MYEPDSLKDKQDCFDRLVSMLCAFSFLRCTEDCIPAPVCLRTCDALCPDLEVVIPMLPSFGTVFKGAFDPAVESVLGNCSDLRDANGSDWRGDVDPDFSLSPQCVLPEVTSYKFHRITCDLDSTMLDRCCQCGGGQDAQLPLSTERHAVLLQIVNHAVRNLGSACKSRKSDLIPCPCLVHDTWPHQMR